ncbi:hypothetical protein DV515_00019333 [Chloebia gouldiae]|uniref:Uncharacterized protein n=1 Tax=Chloebia gouldiae TaxID=44316 RepID=A0A3L8Q515_CHLGU|nr:hypothetical protein DV515_00019333 [Chloebia gouldiae]
MPGACSPFPLPALADLKGKTEDIPCVVGGEEVWTPTVRYQLSPFNHAHKVAKFCYASKVSTPVCPPSSSLKVFWGSSSIWPWFSK